MQTVTFQSLGMLNFKGVQSFNLKTNGVNAKVYGDNSTGKTTLFDSFTWLLFDKDSSNKKDFAIKTLVEGKEVHNLDHAVEATLMVNGAPVTLRKVFKEKWTKKRGLATKEFSGHTTDYFIDEVPVKKKEYEAKVNEIIQEEIFKLLTSPSYFNEVLKWQDKRKTLLEIVGDITDQDVINANPKLKELPTILQNKTVEDYKKIVASKRKAINDELEMIPVQIKENQNMIPELSIDVEGLKSQLISIEQEIDGQKQIIFNINNGKAVVEKEQQLMKLDNDMSGYKREFEYSAKEEIYKLGARLQEERGNLSIMQKPVQQIEHEIDMMKRTAEQNKRAISDMGVQLQQLRDQWGFINSEQFHYEDDCTCPTCKQDLPAEQVEQARQTALEAFNLSKSERLAKATEQGKQLAQRKDELVESTQKIESDIAKKHEEIVALNIDIERKQEDVKKYESKLKDAESKVPDVTQDPKYQSFLQQKSTLQQEITQLKEHASQAVQDVQKEIYALQGKKQEIDVQLSQHANITGIQARIAELEERESFLAKEFQTLEHHLFLTEEFIREKVRLLEEKINSKFKYARFKLFKEQVNGGLEECCETLFEGVPYSSGLNNAAKINVGIDIINTLSEHYGMRAPIFVDNAEAVTKLIDSESQIISLVVSEKDKQLRVEVPGIEYKEAI
ncbi:AAA family ATPase [Rummeliibacillus sp. NPDC094406]|uniref:AAA family ATPase n=1 Tax=Rummeliibacillus sp. NPDC094406 TaxID=3364511 RepID=UPI00381E12D4